MMTFFVKQALLAAAGTALLIWGLWTYVYNIGPCLNESGFTYAWQGTTTAVFLLLNVFLCMLFQNRIEQFLIKKE